MTGTFDTSVSAVWTQGAQSATQDIPAYHLYGERRELPDFLHCERIAARAAKHGWSIAPHRHTRLHQFFWVKDRSLILRLDGQRMHLPAGRVISLPIYRVHGFDFEPLTQGLVVTVAQEEIARVTTQHPAVAACLLEPLVLQTDSALDAAFNGIERQFHCHDSLRPVMLRAQFLSLLGSLARAQVPLPSSGGRAADMVTRLLDLARSCYTDTSAAAAGERKAQQKVSRYAQQLGVSTAHLNRLCQKATGLSPQALIDGVRMQEAKRLLAYTRMTVAEIGYRLGFEDPSYFSRAFKRAQGVSPSSYRDAIDTSNSS